MSLAGGKSRCGGRGVPGLRPGHPAPGHPASSRGCMVMPYRGHAHLFLESLHMTESNNPLVAFSDSAARLVERAAGSIVAVHGGGRRATSGIHWRSGIIVTAEEVLEKDEDIKVTLPGGRLVEA